MKETQEEILARLAIVKAKKDEFENFLRKNKIFSQTGKYLYGIPEYNGKDKLSLVFADAFISICSLYSSTKKEIYKINYSDIIDVSIEDSSTIEKKITATRLLTIGIFAFAAKKKQKHSLFYVNIKWKYGNFTQDTIFEFEGKKSMNEANTMRDIIISHCNT